jgi:ornithine cyclodeaminase/alanine dehydrogenase-like protein (mu-crystallin family)
MKMSVETAIGTTLCGNESLQEIAAPFLDSTAPGRTDGRQITLYKPQGTGIMGVAIGALAYEKLKESNLTQTL